MKTTRHLLALLAGAALLAACGGSDPAVEAPQTAGPSGAPNTLGSFTRVVSFGDSLSDLGAYAPATSIAGTGQPPFFAGRFTTNAYNTYTSAAQQSTGTIWVEAVAARLGLVITPHEVGFRGTSVKCPIAAAVPALANTCTGYGQGGSRVSNPEGNGKSGGALTVPLTTQVANHRARFGNFTAADLVFVWGGANDVLLQHGAFMQVAGAASAAAAAGRITQAEANEQIAAARAGANAEIKAAARALGALVKTNILGAGARYVAVLNIPDIGATPYGNSLAASMKAEATAMSAEFNIWLTDSLTGAPVLWVDSRGVLNDAITNPAANGLTEVRFPACDRTKISTLTGGLITDGSSLFCNKTAGAPFNGLTAGADANTWLFADGVHPTTGGHLVFGTKVGALLKTAGWIN